MSEWSSLRPGDFVVPRRAATRYGPWPGRVCRAAARGGGHVLLQFVDGLRAVPREDLERDYYLLDAPSLSSEAGARDARERLRARLLAAQLVCARETQPLFRLGLQPLPHQLWTASKFLELSGPRRALFFADEVGLGKTVTAGLIAHLLRNLPPPGRVERLAVVCPAPLVQQWADELKRLFQLEVQTPEPGSATADCVVLSIDRLAKLSLDDERWTVTLTPARQLIIFDEVHEARLGSRRQACIRRILAGPEPSNVLFLSATPFAGKLVDFLSLVGLLTPEKFSEALAACELRERWGPRPRLSPGDPARLLRALTGRGLPELMVRHRRREARDMRGNPVLAAREVRRQRVKLNRGERGLLRRLERYMVQHVPSPTKRHALRELAASSWAALRKGLLSRARAARRGGDLARADALDALLDAWPRGDNKLETLCSTLTAEDETLGEPLPGAYGIKVEALRPRFVIFVNLIETRRHLVRELNRRFALQGEPPLARGLGQQPERMAAALDAFRRGETRILVCTRLASRGLNLQGAILVNYDPPWNAAELDQRIGRVHRVGQARPVRIYNFGCRETLDGKVYDALTSAIGRRTQQHLAMQGLSPGDGADLKSDLADLLGHERGFRAWLRGLAFHRKESKDDGAALRRVDEAADLWADLSQLFRRCSGLDELRNLAPLQQLDAVEEKVSAFVRTLARIHDTPLIDHTDARGHRYIKTKPAAGALDHGLDRSAATSPLASLQDAALTFSGQDAALNASLEYLGIGSPRLLPLIASVAHPDFGGQVAAAGFTQPQFGVSAGAIVWFLLSTASPNDPARAMAVRVEAEVVLLRGRPAPAGLEHVPTSIGFHGLRDLNLSNWSSTPGLPDASGKQEDLAALESTALEQLHARLAAEQPPTDDAPAWYATAVASCVFENKSRVRRFWEKAQELLAT